MIFQLYLSVFSIKKLIQLKVLLFYNSVFRLFESSGLSFEKW